MSAAPCSRCGYGDCCVTKVECPITFARRIRNQIVDEGAVVPLITMSKAKSAEVLELVLKTLGELAKTPDNRQKIVDNGGCTPMVDGLKHKKFAIRMVRVPEICCVDESDSPKR